MLNHGYGFLRPDLKTGVRNGIFWSEIGSGFGDAGSTPPPKIPRSTPHVNQLIISRETKYVVLLQYQHVKRL